MRKVKVGCLLFFLVLALIRTLPAQAPTQVEIDAAIAKGMVWLAAQQNQISGSWGTNNKVGKTGLAVVKFETHAISIGMDPLDPAYQYYDRVRKGLDYIFGKAWTESIGMQTHGDPDTDHDSCGVSFFDGSGFRIYETGIAMMAIGASTHPDKPVGVGPLLGQTYKAVLQDAVDYMSYAQMDSGFSRGGWRYGAGNNASTGGTSDNSNSGYALLGLAYAEASTIDGAPGFYCTVPAFVKSELNFWIDYIQNNVDGDPDNGGSGYHYPSDGVNILKTGNLLSEMAFCGDTAAAPRAKDAIAYLVRHWNDASADYPGWKGQASPLTPPFIPPASYQAMYTTMKGLETLPISTIDGIDWYADFADVLVAQQNPNGSWPECYRDDGELILSTEWALLTLEKAAPPRPITHLDAEPPVLINLEDPVGTAWHELYPNYCNRHYLAGWFDSNNNGTLDHGDHIILDNETGYSGWYNVEDVTVTLRLTNSTLNETMYVEFHGDYQEFPFNSPENTTWHEVYPEYGNWFNLTKWYDTNLTEYLNPSDHIEMTPIPNGTNATKWHVDAVKTDLLVTFEKNPDFGDAPDEVPLPAGPIPAYPSNSLSWLGEAVPPNTTSYWQFEEGGGLIAEDYVVDGNDGTLTNGPTWIHSFYGHALRFDGANDYVKVTDVDDSLDFGTGDFSVQAWINASSVSSFRTIVDKRTSPERGYAMFIWSGRLGLQLADETGYGNYYVPADMSIAADLEWHFVFVSVDRENARATFYVDDKEASIPIGHPGSLDNTADLWIGGNQLHSFYFAGGIDEVAIYDRALTPREARLLHHMRVRDGASHVDWNYEWLGKSVNGELDSKQVDKDEFDDGVEMALLPVGGPPPDHRPVYLSLKITIGTSGQSGRYSISDPNKWMYLNAWIDWNGDLDWADSGEKMIGTGSLIGTKAFAGSQTNLPFSFSIPESARLGWNWLRVRLDYGEDVGAKRQSWTDASLDQYKGQAMFGEVEDYLLKSDVAIADVIPSKNVTGQGYSSKINFTVANQGGCTENFNVTVYANATAIGNLTVASLPAGAVQTFSLSWDTTGFAKGSYNIRAYALPLPYENDTSDNGCTYGAVCVSIPGDINGDRKDDLKDVFAVGKAYGSAIGDPRYNPNLDINDDGKIDLKDYFTTCKNYGKSW